MLAPGSANGPSIRPVLAHSEVASLAFGDLSNWFNPFLRYFALESLRSNGEVHVADEGGRVAGVFLHDPVERAGSVFTRSTLIAEQLLGSRAPLHVYAEVPLPFPRDPYEILEVQASRHAPTAPFTHPVRAASPLDRARIQRLMELVHGRFNAAWLGEPDGGMEKCFVSEVDRQVVGAAWVSVVGTLGRFHSLSVSPHYRGLGIGTDLWRARLWWALEVGATRLIAEIASRNVASLAIARRGGMVTVGETHQYFRP